jgi:hypothetical protein
MIELTQAQRQELAQVEPTVTDETWAESAYALAMEVLARDGWDDPRMDMYDKLDPRRNS